MDESSADPKNPAVLNKSSSPSPKPPPADGPIINSDTLPLVNKDKGVRSSVALEDDDNHSNSEENRLGSEKAPVPGNCCNFSTITCSKFWAIFNLVQLFLCWISVCAIHLTTFLGNPDPHRDETVFKLFKCMQGGSAGAQNTRLAFQIILLLVYTAGSILFILANFPPKQVVSHRPLFVKIYTWTIIAFLSVFTIPFIFHLPIGECYYFISVTLWAILVIEFSIFCVVAYFSWRVAKLFRNYLRETSPPSPSNEEDEGKEGKSLRTPPPTPQPSKNDFGTPPPTPKPSIEEVQDRDDGVK